MNLSDIRSDALSLMSHHGLIAKGWRFEFDGAKRRGGYCRHADKTISMSRLTAPTWSDEEVRETLLHEIAHALVGPGYGHGKVWQAKAKAIGSDASRTHSNETAAPNYIGKCARGHEFKRYRMRQGAQYSCNRCAKGFNKNYLITWTRV